MDRRPRIGSYFCAGPKPKAKSIGWVALVGIVIASPACGKRGDPLPPLRRSPAPVERIRVWQQGPFIHLEWSAPNRNADGSAEVELKEASVLRRVGEIPLETVEDEAPDSVAEEEPGEVEEPGAEMEPETEKETSSEPVKETADTTSPVESEEPVETETSEESGAQAVVEESEVPQPTAPPPFPAGAEEIATLESEQVDEVLTFRDPWDPSWEGKRVEYAVRYTNGKGRQSRLSQTVHLDPLPPIDPPKDLATEVEDGLVRLRWSSAFEQAPGATKDGISFGYNVYRRGETEIFPPSPLNSTPVLDTSYEDRDVIFGEPSCYAVRRIVLSEKPDGEETRGAEGTAIESVESEEVCLTPVDTFPPPIPEDVVAVLSPEGVLLSWATVSAHDLEGYLVYRSDEPEGPFEPLTEESVAMASFTDSTAESGEVYFFAVSAVDQTEPWNESPRSPPVSIEIPEN